MTGITFSSFFCLWSFFPSRIVHIQCEQHVAAELPWLQVLVPPQKWCRKCTGQSGSGGSNWTLEKPLTCRGLYTLYTLCVCFFFVFFWCEFQIFVFVWGSCIVIRGWGWACSGLNCCFSGNNCGSPPASAQYKLSIPELLENLQTSMKFCKIRAIFEELSEKKTICGSSRKCLV